MADEQQQAVLGGLRAQLGAALDSVTAEKLKELVEGIFDQTRAKWGYCPACREKVKLDYPDYVAQAKAISLLADQALGRPPETLRIEGGLLLRAQKLAETMPLSKIPSAELHALAESELGDDERKALEEATEAAEEGDWEPLRKLGYRNMSELSDEELREIAGEARSGATRLFAGNPTASGAGKP